MTILPQNITQEMVGAESKSQPNKCRGRDCAQRDQCWRYVSPDSYYQWWDNYDQYQEPNGTCTYKLPLTKEEREKHNED